MKAMIEADLARRGRFSRPRRSGDLVDMPARRLFDQHMLAGLDSAERDGGELVVGRGDDHGIEIGT